MVDAQVVLRFASGAPLILLGALLLAIRPRRPTQVTFGAFAMVWGLRILAANGGILFDDADLHARLLFLSLGLTVIESLLLVHFATLLRDMAHAQLLRMVYGTLAVLTVAAMLLRPAWILEGVGQTPTGLDTSFGFLTPLFVHIPNLSAFLIAIGALYIGMRQARPGTLRHRYRGMVLALNLYLAYLTVRTTLIFSQRGIAATLDGFVGTGSGFFDSLYVVVYLLGTLVLAGIALHAMLRPPPPEGRDVVMALSYVVPASVAAFELYLLWNHDFQMQTWGFWRFLSVGVFVYTLANHQLFDLELKVKRFAAPGVAGLLLIFGIPIALGLALGDFSLQAIALIVLPEIIGTGGVLVFHQRVAEAMFPGVRDEPDYHHQRRLELYKVALEDHLTRGRDPQDPELASLRARYGISQEEHNLLIWMGGFGADRTRKDHDGDLVPGTLVLDRYRIERLLGHGTQRATYLAKDTLSRRLVGIKVVATEALDGAVARLLLRDARLAASIAHPNILSIFDVAETQDRAVIVMDYADQGSLTDRLQDRGAMDFDDALRFAEELLDALQAIHERDIIHRNLKPKNILLDRDGSVLLADFSAAHDQTATEGTGDLDAHAQALFDMLYLSPEQIKGEDATPRSDLYVAAVLIHQALTNRFCLPIQGKDDHQIRQLILDRAPELHLKDDAVVLEPILLRALAKDPAARYASAGAMLDELKETAGLPATHTVTRDLGETPAI